MQYLCRLVPDLIQCLTKMIGIAVRKVRKKGVLGSWIFLGMTCCNCCMSCTSDCRSKWGIFCCSAKYTQYYQIMPFWWYGFYYCYCFQNRMMIMHHKFTVVSYAYSVAGYLSFATIILSGWGFVYFLNADYRLSDESLNTTLKQFIFLMCAAWIPSVLNIITNNHSGMHFFRTIITIIICFQIVSAIVFIYVF